MLQTCWSKKVSAHFFAKSKARLNANDPSSYKCFCISRMIFYKLLSVLLLLSAIGVHSAPIYLVFAPSTSNLEPWDGDCWNMNCTAQYPCFIPPEGQTGVASTAPEGGRCEIHFLAQSFVPSATFSVDVSATSTLLSFDYENIELDLPILTRGPLTISTASKARISGQITTMLQTELGKLSIDNAQIHELSVRIRKAFPGAMNEMPLLVTNSHVHITAAGNTTSGIGKSVFLMDYVSSYSKPDLASLTFQNCTIDVNTTYAMIFEQQHLISTMVDSTQVNFENTSTLDARPIRASSLIAHYAGRNATVYVYIRKNSNIFVDTALELIHSNGSFAHRVDLFDNSSLVSLSSGDAKRLVEPNKPFYMRVMSHSTVAGFFLDRPMLELSVSKIINCPFHLEGSVAILTGESSVIFDSSLPPYHLYHTQPSRMSNLTVQMSNQAILNIRKPDEDYLIVSGMNKFNSTTGNCSINMNGFTWDDDEMGSAKFETACDLSLAGSVALSEGSTSIGYIGGISSQQENTDKFPSLTVNAKRFYDAEIDFTNFRLLQIEADPQSSPLLEAFRGTNPSALAMPSLIITPTIPLEKTRIQWPSTGPSPVKDTTYALFSATQGDIRTPSVPTVGEPAAEKQNFTFSVITEEDRYQFSIHSIEVPGTSNYTVKYMLYRDMRPVPMALCPPPPPGFSCTPDGNWVANGSVTIPGTLIISTPSVTVIGNLSTGSLTFLGNEHQITVIDGCLTISSGGSIVIDVSSGNWKTGTATLIKQNSNCPNTLDKIPISIKQPNNDCKRPKAKISPNSSRSSLIVIFTTDNKECNIKWILLGSTLGATIFITIVTVIIISSIIGAKRKKAEMAKALGKKQKRKS